MKPTKVPFQPQRLSSLGHFLRGRGISKSHLVARGLPAVLYGDLYARFDGVIDAAQVFISPKTADKSTEIQFGDILFPTAGETSNEIGKPSAYLSKFAGYAGGDIIVFRPNNPEISSYLTLALRTNDAYRYRYRMAQGQSIVHINQSNLEDHPVVVATDVEAQKIASTVSTWDRAIELTETLIAAKQQRKQALTQQLLRTANVKWPKTKLGELFENRKKKGIEDLHTYSVTLNDGLVLRDSLDRKNETSLAPAQHLLIEKGDIAYNMMRMWQGASGLAPEAGLVSPAYVVLRSRGEVDPLFASYWFKMPRVVKKFQDYSHGLTKDRLRLYYKDFASITLPVPPLTLQKKIANVMQCCDRELAILQQKLALLKQQKKGLMQQLLTGKIRVKLPKGAV